MAAETSLLQKGSCDYQAVVYFRAGSSSRQYSHQFPVRIYGADRFEDSYVRARLDKVCREAVPVILRKEGKYDRISITQIISTAHRMTESDMRSERLIVDAMF